MTVREIVTAYLKENGYDGLYLAGECGCEIKDLMPCGEFGVNCEAGYGKECKDCKEETCDARAEGSEWCIGPKEGGGDGST